MENTPLSPIGRVEGSTPARPRRRGVRRLATVLIAASLVAVTGCAANFGAETQAIYQPAVGSDDRTGDVFVLNALVLGDGQGDGTLVTTLINQTSPTDFLTGVTATVLGGGGVDVGALPPVSSTVANAPSTGLELATQAAVKLPEDGVIQLNSADLKPGGYLTLTLTFKESAPLDIDVPIIAEGPIYDGITVGPIVSAATTPAS